MDDSSNAVLLSMDELRVLRGASEGSFVVKHARLGSLLSGSSSRPDGSLLWYVDAFDAVLADVLLPVPRHREWRPVALYNPMTFEVALDPLPRTRSFSDGGQIVFDEPMLDAAFDRDGCSLHIVGRLLPELPASFDRARMLAAPEVFASSR